MNYKKSYLLFNSCTGLGTLACVISLALKIDWIGILGLVIFIVGILQAAVWYRCPKCGKSLNFRGRKPKHCPECGFKLDF